jgi:DNA-binding LytR/AlgR family response regulator
MFRRAPLAKGDMRVLVVDDEPIARRRLIRMIELIEGVAVAGEAGDGQAALVAIDALVPDAVLLDIRMPHLDGLTLARSHRRLPPIIFTTAYDEYAVQAFEACAVDYLLKPIEQQRLAMALAKVRLRAPDAARALLELRSWFDPDSRVPADLRVVVRDRGSVRFFDAASISRFYATDKYSGFRIQEEEYLFEESLSSLEQRLGALEFVRVHRSELIRLPDVVSLRPDVTRGWVELRDGQRARVSRRHISRIKRRLTA